MKHLILLTILLTACTSLDAGPATQVGEKPSDTMATPIKEAVQTKCVDPLNVVLLVHNFCNMGKGLDSACIDYVFGHLKTGMPFEDIKRLSCDYREENDLPLVPTCAAAVEIEEVE